MAILVLRFWRGFQAPSARFPRITTAVRAYQSLEHLRKWRWIPYPCNGCRNVQIDNRIPAQHQRRLVEETTKILDSAHPARRAEGLGHDVAVVPPALVGVAHLHAPASAVAKEILDLVMVERHIHHDLPNIVAGQMFDQILHERLAENGHHGLGHILSKRAHPGSLTCGQNHSFSHYTRSSNAGCSRNKNKNGHALSRTRFCQYKEVAAGSPSASSNSNHKRHALAPKAAGSQKLLTLASSIGPMGFYLTANK
jgi:hypothetical protein